jgi:hypothetical protein
VLEWLSNSALAGTLAVSQRLYIFANAAHILSVSVLVGAIVPLDLRILGLFKSFPLSVLGPFLSRASIVGVVLSIATGLVLFTANAVEYAANPAFLTKIGLLAVGVANAAFLHASPRWRQAVLSGSAPLAIKLAAAVSLTMWISAVVAGRWIGFL